MESGPGRGRGIATNVPELALIEQVRLRPLLYDKNVKDYRKPNASEAAWQEVAINLETTAANCRKRWKSLRDTFIKYYRQNVTNQKNRHQRKSWMYYKSLIFLIPHIEIYRMDESTKHEDMQQMQNDSIPIYLKEDYQIVEKHMLFAEENDDETVTYRIKVGKNEYDDEEHIAECIEQESLVEGNYVEEEERIDNNTEIVDIEEHDIKFQKDTYVLVEQQLEDTKDTDSIANLPTEPSKNEVVQESPSEKCTDPDERYLLSCLPAFKRLTPQQKAQIRMGIERLFYEVEFQTDEQPKNKRYRLS